MEEDVEIIEASDSSTKSVSMKEIILRQISRISQIASQELTPSYLSKKPVKVGTSMVMLETYHEDKRKAYINAVSCLLDLTYSFIYINETFIKFLTNQETEAKQEEKKGEEITIAEWTNFELTQSRELFREIINTLSAENFFESEDYGESA